MSLSPAELATLHATAFEAPWDEASLAALLASPGVFAISQPGGFILIRVVLDEAEVLTLAVDPAIRRQGLGRRLLDQAVIQAAGLGAQQIFLEVATSNEAAKGLYEGAGFEQTGLRRGYYAKSDGTKEDALVLSLKFFE